MFFCLVECLPADPAGRDAMQREQSELKVVCGAWRFFAAPPPHGFSICGLGQRRRAEGDRGRAKGAQVELGQVVDSLR